MSTDTTSAPKFWYSREHDWIGGWAVRNQAGIVCLVYDKLVAATIATLLDESGFVLCAGTVCPNVIEATK